MLAFAFHDAITTCRILEDMGVLQELVDNNEAHFADAGEAQHTSGHAILRYPFILHW